MKTLFLPLVFLLPLSLHAQTSPEVVRVGSATYRFADRRFEEVFKRTLIFGHSISSGLMHKLFTGFGDSPGAVLSRHYARVEPLANISEGIGRMETGLNKMYRWVDSDQLSDTDTGTGSDRDILVMNRHFKEALVIVGVDALYMSAVFNDCEGFTDYGVYSTLNAFTQKTFREGKVLILGTVPKENWNQMSSIAQLVLKNDNEACRQTLNKALRATCTPERNCYYTDLEDIVARLNTTGQLQLKDGTILKDDYSFGAGVLGRRQVRPDGVNLSDQGVQVVVEDILKKLAANPPRLSPGLNGLGRPQ